MQRYICQITISSILAIAATLILGACGDSDTEGERTSGDAQVIQLGEPPTHAWPGELICHSSMASLCDAKNLPLVGTVNFARESVVTAVTFGSEAHIVCRWPVDGDQSCKAIGPKGVSVRGEGAVYSVPEN